MKIVPVTITLALILTVDYAPARTQDTPAEHADAAKGVAGVAALTMLSHQIGLELVRDGSALAGTLLIMGRNVEVEGTVRTARGLSEWTGERLGRRWATTAAWPRPGQRDGQAPRGSTRMALDMNSRARQSGKFRDSIDLRTAFGAAQRSGTLPTAAASDDAGQASAMRRSSNVKSTGRPGCATYQAKPSRRALSIGVGTMPSTRSTFSTISVCGARSRYSPK